MLYRDCLRIADYISTRGGNRVTLRTQVREAFRKNKGETDPVEIEKQRTRQLEDCRIRCSLRHSVWQKKKFKMAMIHSMGRLCDPIPAGRSNQF